MKKTSLFETAFASAPDASTVDADTVNDVETADLSKYVWKKGLNY